MRTRWIPVLSLFALLFAPVAYPDEPPPDLAEKERAAFDKVATELVKLSRVCTQSKAFAEARAVLDLGLRIHPESEELKAAREAVEGQADEPRASFAKQYPKKREDAFLRCAKALASAALALDREGHPDRFERLFALAQKHFPSEDGCEAFKLEYYEPYRRWMHKEEVDKLEKGYELANGEWLDPDAVEKGNSAHASWSDPWLVSDGIHQVRTTLPLRKAMEVLGHATAFREFFLAEFEGEWDLRPPAGLLPIDVAATQADFQARVKVASAGIRSVSTNVLPGAALYYWTSNPLNPVLMTYEPVFPTSRGGTVAVKVGDEELFSVLQHELTHQIAHEYSRFGYVPKKYTKHCYGALEGLANFFSCYRLTPVGFRLTFKPRIPQGDRTQDAPFAWTKSHLEALPGLLACFAKNDAGLKEPEDYLYLATAAYFLLHGAEGRYRKAYVSVLEIVHQIREDAGTFTAAFEGIPEKQMQEDWIRFVREIPASD